MNQPLPDSIDAELPRPGGWAHLALLILAIENTVRHPLRLFVTLACLIAVVTPFTVGLAILQGVKHEALQALDAGPDLFITGYEQGRNISMPQAVARHVRTLHQAVRVQGRIVGRTNVGPHLITLVGLDPEGGEPVPSRGNVWLGFSMAQSLQVKEGDTLILEDMSQITLNVDKILQKNAGLAAARMGIVRLSDAQELFATPDRLSDLQIWVNDPLDRQGPAGNSEPGLPIAFQLRLTGIPLRIQTRKLASDYVNRGFGLKGGTFYALFLVAFALVIPALLVTSGFGLSVRRKEIALMKAIGFSVLDILEMAFFEVIYLSMMASTASFAFAWAWIRIFEGAGVAPFFIAGLELGPNIPVPAIFQPLPLFVSIGLSLVLLSTGVMSTTFQAATSDPTEDLR